MTRLAVLRLATAALLAASGVGFGVASHLERAGHHETAAEHARETGSVPTPSESPAFSPAATVAPATTSPVMPDARPRLTTAADGPSKDPRLNAPEGSKEREAAERAAKHPNPHSGAARSSTDPPRSAAAPPSPVASETSASDAAEGSAAHEAGERTSPAAGSGHAESSEELFGINTESTAVVAAALAATGVLLLLVLVAPPGRRLLFVAAATSGFGAAAAVLDVREAVHQSALGDTGLLTAALVVAVLHALAATLALALTRLPPGRGNPSADPSVTVA